MKALVAEVARRQRWRDEEGGRRWRDEEYEEEEKLPIRDTIPHAEHPALIQAMKDGCKACAYFLVRRPFTNVNAIDEVGVSALHYAVSPPFAGDLLITEIVGKSNADVNISSQKDGSAPLHTAVKEGNRSAVAVLLTARGIDVNKSNTAGFTPLQLAVLSGSRRSVEQLLAAPSIVASKITSGSIGYVGTALSVAVVHCKHDNKQAIVQLLLRSGKLDVTQEALGCVDAARYGRQNVMAMMLEDRDVAALIARGCQASLMIAALQDPSVGMSAVKCLLVQHCHPDHAPPTLLMALQRKAHDKIIMMLLEHSRVVTWLGSKEGSQEALHTAASNKHLSAVKLLLPLCDPHAACSVLCKVLTDADDASTGMIDTVAIFLQHDRVASCVKEGSISKQIMAQAVRTKAVGLICYLLPHCDISALLNTFMPAIENGIVSITDLMITSSSMDLSCQGFLALAASMGKYDMLVEMLKFSPKNMDINCVVDSAGTTVLHQAAASVSPHIGQVVQLLLAQPGIDINARCSSGKTPLAYAVARRTCAVKPLVEAGAMVNIAEADSCTTPMHVAAGHGDVALVRLLLTARGAAEALIMEDKPKGNIPSGVAKLHRHMYLAKLLCPRQVSGLVHRMHVTYLWKGSPV